MDECKSGDTKWNMSNNLSVSAEEPKGCRPVPLILNILKVTGAVAFIYIFIFSIGLLSDSFQVLGGSFLNLVILEIQGINMLF